MIYKKCPHKRACHKTCNHDFRQKVQYSNGVNRVDWFIIEEAGSYWDVNMPGRGRGGLASFLKDWVCKHNIVGCLILQNGSGRNANKRNVVGYMGVENCNEKGGFNNALHLPSEESTTSHNIILILCVLHSSKRNKNISWPLLTLSASNKCLLLMAYLSTHTEFLILRTFLKAVLQQFSLFKWLFMSGRSNDCRVMRLFTPRL